MNAVTNNDAQDSQKTENQTGENTTLKNGDNQKQVKQDDIDIQENNYLSPKAQKLLQKRENLQKEIEVLNQALEDEIKEARKKTVDALVTILDKNGLLDVSPKVWKSKISEVVKIFKQ
ncbi:hypothetical protein ACG9XS_18505 [Acinetobacter gyllenbergii]|uniref:hypothetical protein n=1 Tax=Acinetobacter gyllenbergii TaxID=134534 RepID=UPI003AF4ADC7